MIRPPAFLAASFLIASSLVLGQTYPSRHIPLIIPFAAGGSNDIVGRAIGKKLSEAWGQPVVVETRPGAGGFIGRAAVPAAPPDGYTLLLVSSTFTINPAIKKSMPFDTLKDFTPVAFIARSPLLVTASNNLPVNSMKELLEIARSQPGKITYASSGPGSINQISAELIALSAGVKFVHIPYRGGRAAAQRPPRRPRRYLRVELAAGAPDGPYRPSEGPGGDKPQTIADPAERANCR